MCLRGGFVVCCLVLGWFCFNLFVLLVVVGWVGFWVVLALWLSWVFGLGFGIMWFWVWWLVVLVFGFAF